MEGRSAHSWPVRLNAVKVINEKPKQATPTGKDRAVMTKCNVDLDRIQDRSGNTGDIPVKLMSADSNTAGLAF
jgi:hypothetical protein